MKKILSAILVVSLALSIAGCAPSAEEIKGSVDGQVYTNEYLGLTFNAPSSFRFLSDDEISDIFGATGEILADGGVDAEVNPSYYDMMAMDETTGSNISLMLQIGTLGTTDYDDFLDEAEKSIMSMGEAIGAAYSFSAHAVVKLGEVEFHKIEADADMNLTLEDGSTVSASYTQGSYIGEKDGVVVNMTITSFDGTPISEFEAMMS